MRVRTFVRCSASIAAFVSCAAPALAQSAPDASAPQDATAQPAPAQPDPAAQNEGDAIVVTGFRESFESQRNIRRNSEQIVDAIVAEDIGKLPDIAVSDTAARIPGVQVERGGGEAGRVLVRGLPDFTTTYNGREIFTAEQRSVALQDFPSGLIGAIEVYKTSSADLIEPGLAGLINVRSRRPFDFESGLSVTGSVWGLYTHQAETITPNGNVTIAGRWDAGEGEIGALVGFSYTRLRYLDSTRSNTDFVAPGPNGTRYPDIQRITYGSGDRERPSLNAALQWRPNPDVEIYVEGLWQGFRNRISDRETSVNLYGGSSYTNLATRPDRPDLLESGTVVGPRRPEGFQGGTFNQTDTYQIAVGGHWDMGALRISADLAYTDSTFTGSTESVDFNFASSPTVDFDTDIDGNDGGANFEFVSFDPSNPANYIFRGLYEAAQQATGQDVQARLDFNYDTSWSVLPEIVFGVRYTDRDAHAEFGDRYFYAEPQGIGIGAVPLDYELFDPGFRGSSVPASYRSWLSPTYSSIRNNVAQLRQFVIARGAGNFTVDAPGPDPLRTWNANERQFSAYLQARYEIPLGGEAVLDGNIGLRYAKSELELTGTRLVFPAGGGAGVNTPTDVDREFEDWLPSINARLRFSPQIQARLSFTQTRTRPSFIDLRPSGTIDPPPSCFNVSPVPANCFLTGGGGNPFLEPLTSDNYDAAIEYFFSRTGYITLSAFKRELTGFIEGSVTQVTAPDGRPLRLGGPINSGAGEISGFEVQASTFFDFIGLPQVGLQANLTYLDSSAQFTYDAGVDGSGVQQFRTADRPLLGISEWSYNIVAIYESNGLSARLAYNWRDKFLATYQDRGDHLYTEEADPVSRLDLSVSYDLFENLTIFGDWTNILGDPFTSSLTRLDLTGPTMGTSSTFPRFTRFEESTVSIGARFRF